MEKYPVRNFGLLSPIGQPHGAMYDHAREAIERRMVAGKRL